MKKPKTIKAPRGRPAYQPKAEDRMSVEQMVFCGESQLVIARALGIDINTLRKHFAYELANGYANRSKEVIGLLFAAARKENLTATRRLADMGKVAGAAEAMERRAEQHQVSQPKLGKKQEQQAAAAKVGGKYAPPAPPRLIVNNK